MGGSGVIRAKAEISGVEKGLGGPRLRWESAHAENLERRLGGREKGDELWTELFEIREGTKVEA